MEPKWTLADSAIHLREVEAARLDSFSLDFVEQLLNDANRGADLKAEETTIDSALDAAIATTRHRTSAQSADGFLRDALVMLADKKYRGEMNCGTAVRAIGKALEAVGCMIVLEGLDGRVTQPAKGDGWWCCGADYPHHDLDCPNAAKPAKGGDATAT